MRTLTHIESGETATSETGTLPQLMRALPSKCQVRNLHDLEHTDQARAQYVFESGNGDKSYFREMRRG